ncbi:MAG: C2 family cysteine protease [Polyangiaceae bacterium]
MGHHQTIARRRYALRADTRGANLVEYMVVVGLIAILAMFGWRAFGSRVDASAEAQARCIETFSCAAGVPTHADGQPLLGAAAMPARPSGGRPDFGGAENPDLAGDFEGATYQTLDGEVSITGAGEDRGFDESDVSQGDLADCYLAAALAELALRDPAVLEKAVRDNGDGTFTVTFYEKGVWWWEPDYYPVEITVSGDFPRKADGTWVYMKPGDDGREMWPMIIEKAYAQWEGGGDYADIEQGNATVPMEALTGRDADATTDYRSIYDRWERGEAITLLTPDMSDHSKQKALYANGTLLFNHYYYVVGVDRQAGTVTVRNPWGWDKGTTVLKIEDVEKHFEHMATGPTR